MSYIFLECPNRINELKDDKTMMRSMVDYKLGKYKNYNEAEIEFAKDHAEFRIREGLD